MSIKTIIFISVIVGITIAVNTGMLYWYLIKNRRKELIVMGIVGASKLKRFKINMTEIAVISALTICIGMALMHLVLKIYFIVYMVITTIYLVPEHIYSPERLYMAA